MMERTRLVQMVKASLRLGRPLFSLATIVFGVETLLYAGLVDQTYSRKYDPPIEVVPVIPWLPSSLPWLANVFGPAFAALGVPPNSPGPFWGDLQRLLCPTRPGAICVRCAALTRLLFVPCYTSGQSIQAQL